MCVFGGAEGGEGGLNSNYCVKPIQVEVILSCGFDNLRNQIANSKLELHTLQLRGLFSNINKAVTLGPGNLVPPASKDAESPSKHVM